MPIKWRTLKLTKYPGIRRAPDGQLVAQVSRKDIETDRYIVRSRTLPRGSSLDEALTVRMQLVEEIRTLNEGKEEKASTTKLGDYARRWLVRKQREGLRAHTIDRYQDSLRLHILPFLGEHLLSELGPGNILRWRDWAAARLMKNGKPYSRWTISSWHTVLRSILGDATVEFDLSRNPCHGVKGVRKPKAPRQHRRLTARQIQEFLRLVKIHCPQHHAITLILVLYGLRWEEASALRREHLDVDAMELRIVQTHVRGRLYPTKNESQKLLPLHSDVLEAIEAEQVRLKVEGNPGYKEGKLFPGRNGEYRFPSSVSKGWKAVSRVMSLEFNVTPHDLRRSYQNLLRQAAVNQVVQQALMGHSSDRMTEHYSHIDMDEKRAAQDRVVDLLKFKEAQKKPS
jgi:integrase